MTTPTPQSTKSAVSFKPAVAGGARARDGGMSQLSPIRFEQNVRAARLYKSLGFRIIDTRDIVLHALIRFTGKALLMAARVRPARVQPVRGA